MKHRRCCLRAWLPLAAALLLCLLAGGCQDAPAAAGTPAPDTVQLVLAQPSATPAPQRAPVGELGCLSPLGAPQFAALGGGMAVSCWVDYDYVPETGEDRSSTHVDILDLPTGTVRASTVLAGELSLMERTFAGGAIVLRNYEQSHLLVLDSALDTVATLEQPCVDGQLSYDHQRYYYELDGLLYCMDTQTGESGRVALQWDLRLSYIAGIHPTQDLLTVYVYRSPYSMASCLAVVDGRTGAFSMLTDRLDSPVYGADGGFYALRFCDEPEGEETPYAGQEILYGRLDGGVLSRVSTLSLREPDAIWRLLPQSPYALCVREPWDEEAADALAPGHSWLYRLGERIGACDLEAYGVNGSLLGAVWLPDEELLLASIYEDGRFRILLFDPAQLAFADAGAPERVESPLLVDSAVAERYLEEVRGPVLPEALQGVRAQADALERQYGVEILLSAECEAPCAQSEYRVTTTDRAGLADEAALLESSLGFLQDALTAYPDGFFRQFRNGADEGGLRFMLIGPIESQNGTIGYQYDFGDWYNIALDCTMGDITASVYHEIWHATENRICASQPELFYDGRWEACNPEGFDYYNTYYPEEMDQGRWTYYAFDGGTEVYFVDAYSRTYAKEDRARLMEYVMGYPDEADRLLQYPAMQKKLALLCQAVRSAFDTAGWEEVRWERYA